MTLDESFTGGVLARRIFDALRVTIADIGASDLKVTKSQIVFRRRRAVAWAWIIGRYLRGDRAPLVLTIALSREDMSKRWTQIISPAIERYPHRLELQGPEEIDLEVRIWLHEAWSRAEKPVMSSAGICGPTLHRESWRVHELGWGPSWRLHPS